jgi:hypothetical protein
MKGLYKKFSIEELATTENPFKGVLLAIPNYLGINLGDINSLEVTTNEQGDLRVLRFNFNEIQAPTFIERQPFLEKEDADVVEFFTK